MNVLESSAARRPKAEKRPGCNGMTIRVIPSSSAKSQACNGPAPPKLISVYSLGSRPRSMLTSLRALLTLSLTIRRIRSAVFSTDIPSLRLSCPIASTARSVYSLRLPLSS